jgi:hypothetical protein
MPYISEAVEHKSPIRLSVATETLWNGDRSARIAGTKLTLLAYMCRNPLKWVGIDVFNRLHPRSPGCQYRGSKVLQVHICNIRSIGRSIGINQMIRSIYGQCSYKITIDVEVVDDPYSEKSIISDVTLSRLSTFLKSVRDQDRIPHLADEACAVYDMVFPEGV